MTQIDMFDTIPEPDPTTRYHRGNQESFSAHASIAEHAATLRNQIKNFIRSRGDATCDEVELALGMSHQTASARMTELKRDNEIVPTVKRDTRSGRKAMAWRLI